MRKKGSTYVSGIELAGLCQVVQGLPSEKVPENVNINANSFLYNLSSLLSEQTKYSVEVVIHLKIRPIYLCSLMIREHFVGRYTKNILPKP